MLSKAIKVGLAASVIAASTFIAGPASGLATDRKINVDGARDKWKPQHPFVRRGGDGKAKVVWKNPTMEGDHDIKSVNTGTDWTLRRKMLQTNNRNKAAKVFKKNGNYYFICTIHSTKENGFWKGMYGIVHVRK